MSEGKDLHGHSCGVTDYVQCNLVSLKTSSSLKKGKPPRRHTAADVGSQGNISSLYLISIHFISTFSFVCVLT